MWRIRWTAVSWSAIGVVAFARTAASQVTVQDPLAARVDAYLQRLVPFGFSGAVAVLEDGNPILLEGYGLAVDSARIPVSPHTAFNIASLSKQFTAAAAMRLVMDGKLSSEDTLGRFFDGLPPEKAAITVHQLLTHTAGIPSTLGETAPQPLTREAFMALVSREPLEFAPGSEFRYSNGGYAVLAAVIERAAGEPLDDFMRRTLFVPAGMHHTGHITQTDLWSPDSLAWYYRARIPQGSAVAEFRARASWTQRGSRGIVTTAEDMARWEQALERHRVLSPGVTDRMFQAYTNEYGYGWGVYRDGRGARILAHSGHDMPEGFNAMMVRLPDDGLAFVVLSNRGEFSFSEVVASRLRRLLLGDTVVPPPSTDPRVNAEAIAGSYVFADGSRVDIEATGPRLLASLHGQGAVTTFLGLKETEAKRLAEFNKRTAEFAGAVYGGRLAEIADRLPSRKSQAEWGEWFATVMRTLEERHGPYRGFEVLHTVPVDNGYATYVRLMFEAGAGAVGWFWSKDGTFQGSSGPGSVQAAGGVSVLPGEIVLVQVSDTELATYDPETEAIRRFAMRRDDRGRAAAILFGSVAAERTGSGH